MTMCERVDSILKARGMSRRKLALEAHIPPSSFQSAMARNGDLPTDMMFRISKVLNVSVYFLAKGDDGNLSPNIDLNEFNEYLSALEFDFVDDFFEKLGYEIFIDGNHLANQEMRASGNVFVVNDIKNNKFYYATTPELNQLAHTVLSFTHFQIHELLHHLPPADKKDIYYYQIMQNNYRPHPPQSPSPPDSETIPEDDKKPPEGS